MLNIKVKELMTKNVITVKPDEEVVFAFEKLMKEKISSMPVIDNDQVIGIVTATDLGHNLILDNYQLGTIVKQVMVKNVASVSSESSLKDAILLMHNQTPGKGIINQLPVIDNGKLVGIISDGDVIEALCSEI